MEKQIICIYHKDCVDGTTAAAVVLKKFQNAQAFPLAHNYTEDEIESILSLSSPDAHIYIVDCVLGLTECLTRGYQVTVIDHHISEHTRVSEIATRYQSLIYMFDTAKSGASLTWSYLYPEVPQPTLITYVEDNDLWTQKLGIETEHVTHYLSLYRNDPYQVVALFEIEINTLITQGTVLTTYAHTVISNLILLDPITVRIEEHEVLAYNITDYQSACGNVLSHQNGCAVALYTIIGSQVKCSFRSESAHEPSALSLAMSLGGGGHRNTSGATISLTDFMSRILPISP